MTVNQFWDISNQWYQRTHRLRRVWQNPEETNERRLKAYFLFLRMNSRISACMQIAMKITLPKYKNGLSDVGGLTIVGDNKKEELVMKRQT